MFKKSFIVFLTSLFLFPFVSVSAESYPSFPSDDYVIVENNSGVFYVDLPTETEIVYGLSSLRVKDSKGNGLYFDIYELKTDGWALLKEGHTVSFNDILYNSVEIYNDDNEEIREISYDVNLYSGDGESPPPEDDTGGQDGENDTSPPPDEDDEGGERNMEGSSVNVTEAMLEPISSAITSNLDVLLPVGIGIMAIMIGVSLIPRIVYKFF